jgi:hypothetical protein
MSLHEENKKLKLQITNLRHLQNKDVVAQKLSLTEQLVKQLQDKNASLTAAYAAGKQQNLRL